MRVAGAAKRYAQAAFEIAREQGTLEEWEQDLQILSDALQDPAVSEFFESPAVPIEAKQQAIEKVLPGESQRYVRNLALLLLERGRLAQLPQVYQVFHDLVLEARGIAVADVTTAVPLSEAEEEQVRTQLAQMIGKTVEMRPHVDPEIIGGLVVRVDDTLIDGSVRTQLAELRQRMEG